MIILPICYFPPVHWYAALLAKQEVVIEVHQHYRKQQLTSRTYIQVANRVLPLTIPVRRRGAKIPIKEKKISFEEKWQIQHWRSIANAYKNSPYFDYYEREIYQSLMKQTEELGTFLLDQIMLINELLGIETKHQLSEEYIEGGEDVEDLRNDFDPSLENLPQWFVPHTYTQVFGEFCPGLSILDLLFNLGPESKSLLIRSIEKG